MHGENGGRDEGEIHGGGTAYSGRNPSPVTTCSRRVRIDEPTIRLIYCRPLIPPEDLVFRKSSTRMFYALLKYHSGCTDRGGREGYVCTSQNIDLNFILPRLLVYSPNILSLVRLDGTDDAPRNDLFIWYRSGWTLKS